MRYECGKGEFNMRAMLGAICLVMAAAPAWATNCGHANSDPACAGPAPLLGLGIPAAVAVGGALFGARLLKKKKK
jgi:uncharacterized membrane protein YedE/YeeE